MGKDEYVATLKQLFEPVVKTQLMIGEYANQKQFPQTWSLQQGLSQVCEWGQYVSLLQ